MANRICVNFKGLGFIPVNSEEYRVTCGQPIRVGDDVIIKVGDFLTMREVFVRRLRSDGMAKDVDFLVDIKGREAWELK